MSKLIHFLVFFSPLLLTAQRRILDTTPKAAEAKTIVTTKGVPESALPFNNQLAQEQKLQMRKELLKSLVDSSLLANEKELSIDNLDNLNKYSQYVQVVKNALKRRIETHVAAGLYNEADMLRHSLVLLNGIDCLEEQRKDKATYVRQKDLDGNIITAFPLESLKGNARYGLVESFKEGYARIKKDQVFGFLNMCGDEVVPCQYETAEPFNGGRALVKKVVWYFVDGENKESDVLYNIEDAKALTQGMSLARFKDGKYALINNRYDVTKKASSNFYDEIMAFSGKEIFRVRNGNSYGLINLQGQVVLPPQYELIEPSGAAHLMRLVQNGKVGLMDTMWKIKIDPTYRSIANFDINNGLAWAQTENGYCLLSSRTYKNSGTYKGISTFNSKGLAVTQNQAGLYGIINNQLEVIFEPKYSFIGDFNEYNLATVGNPAKKFGYINTKGIEIIPPTFDEIGSFNKFGLVIAKEERRNGRNKVYKVSEIYNKFGQGIVTKSNDTLGTTSNLSIDYEFLDTLMSGRFTAVKKLIDGDAIGIHLIEVGAYRLITPLPYLTVSDVDDAGLIRYKFGSLWGMIDTAGKVLLQPTYLEIRRPGEGYYAVKGEDEKYGFIDRRGKIQIPMDYQDVKVYKKGHCVVTKGKEKWGLINKFNAKVVPCYFKSVNFNDEQIEMTDDKGLKYVIDEKGDCLQNCQKFEEIRRKANTK